MLALLRHPEQLNRLRARPELAGQAIEEVLRWDAPTQLAQRVATEDLTIGGVTVRKGAPMIVVLGSANRDEALLPDSERFDISRPHIPHLAFEIGPHFCLGAALARIEGEIALAALVERFPEMKLAAQGVRRRDTLVLRGLAGTACQPVRGSMFQQSTDPHSDAGLGERGPVPSDQRGLQAVQDLLDHITGFWRTAIIWAAFDLHVPEHIAAAGTTR